MGQNQATKEVVWLKLLLDELNAPSSKDISSVAISKILSNKNNNIRTSLRLYSVIIHYNNQGVIVLLKNFQAHAKSKHNDIQRHN